MESISSTVDQELVEVTSFAIDQEFAEVTSFVENQEFAEVTSFVENQEFAEVTSFVENQEFAEAVDQEVIVVENDVFLHPADSYLKYKTHVTHCAINSDGEWEERDGDDDEDGEYGFDGNNGGCNNGDYDCMCDMCMVLAMGLIFIDDKWVKRTPQNSAFVNGIWIAI